MDKRIITKVENACAYYGHDKKTRIAGVSLKQCLVELPEQRELEAVLRSAYGAQYLEHARNYIITELCAPEEALV